MKISIIALTLTGALWIVAAPTAADASPLWEFLKIIFSPTPTGGCDASGRCADMLY